MVCSSFKLAYPSSFYGVFCVSSTFAMIVPTEWREQIKVQVRIHPPRCEIIVLDVPVVDVAFPFCLADQVFCNSFEMYGCIC